MWYIATEHAMQLLEENLQLNYVRTIVRCMYFTIERIVPFMLNIFIWSSWIEEMFKDVNNVDKLSLKGPWQNGPYTNTHLEQHETCETTRRNRYSQQTIFVCF